MTEIEGTNYKGFKSGVINGELFLQALYTDTGSIMGFLRSSAQKGITRWDVIEAANLLVAKYNKECRISGVRSEYTLGSAAAALKMQDFVEGHHSTNISLGDNCNGIIRVIGINL
ncbi:MAG: hypothetical protein V7782_11425 [Psychromonas sp.]